MKSVLSKTLWRTVLPLVLGVGAGIWLYKRDVDTATLRDIVFDWHTVAGLLLAAIFVFGRDFGLAWRFHTLVEPELSWKRAFRTDIMCAFTSAITPSVVGGSALAVFYLNREGIGVGRATSLTLTTLFLDELFFVIFCPVIVLLIPLDNLFGMPAFENGGERMFRGGVPSFADSMVETSHWVKGRSRQWWMRVFGSTVLSWFSRYFVVNAIFWAFVPGASPLLVFARQFVVWVVLMISPTPGGSGISEWLFAGYYGDLIGSVGMAAVIAMVWRVFSYYIYLIAGCIMLPSYFGSNSRVETKQE